MSTEFRFLNKEIKFSDVIDGRLRFRGVHVHKPKKLHEGALCLKDKYGNYLWIYEGEKGDLCALTRYMPNGSPEYILAVLEDVFEDEIVSEYDYRFWGAESQEDFERFISGCA